MRIYSVVLTIWVGITMSLFRTTAWQLVRHVESFFAAATGQYLPAYLPHLMQKPGAFAAQSVSPNQHQKGWISDCYCIPTNQPAGNRNIYRFQEPNIWPSLSILFSGHMEPPRPLKGVGRRDTCCIPDFFLNLYIYNIRIWEMFSLELEY